MIGFSAPWALLGLFAAALPILLHLAQRRETPEVSFPAVRYLDDTTREHRRRLKLRHWLLLAVRTLLIIALVLAAAGMTLRRTSLGGHQPSALVLVVDNSASSGLMVDGTPMLRQLAGAAAAVLGQATVADRLWLLTADGVARAGSAPELQTRLGALVPAATRLDLGEAISRGRELVQGSGLPGEVVIVTDLQRSALGTATGKGDVLVLHPDAASVANRAIGPLEPLSQPWGLGGGDVRVGVLSADTVPVPVTLSLGGEHGTHRELLLTPGVPATVHLDARAVGWSTLTASIPPDEMRLDDVEQVAVHVARPAAVRWSTTDRFIDAALEVLRSDSRIIPGDAIHVGDLAAGTGLLLPPEDPAQLGGINRALSGRGIPWQFGTVVDAPATSDSNALLPVRVNISRRVTLRATGATGEVLATVQGEPWLVRGGDLLIAGSRFDPAWSDLPVSASFVPLLDALLTRVMHGSAVAPLLPAGGVFTLPGTVNRLMHDGASQSAEGGAPWRATQAGIHYLLNGSDTIGSVSVHIDPRESHLVSASPDEVRALWPGAQIASLRDSALAFGAGRGDLRKTLLVVAAICVVLESLLARRGAGATV